MASSSPYTQNDYAAVSNFRPYQLPINAIAQAYMAQNRFWDMGAQRVKSVYDNALNLSLTTNDNKQVRDQFMKDAEKQITKLSSMNLADPSVQRQGFGIFKPIFQDDAIMQDDYLTDLQGRIISDANKYRNDPKTKGSGFSNTNLGYALDGFQQFNSKTPRNKVGELYNSLKNKQYEPYYDYAKEFMDVVKGCHGPTTQSPQEGTDYLVYQSGASDTRLQQCLTSTLSDKAKRQIEIEGYMAFKNQDGSINYGGLSDAYASKFERMAGDIKKTSDSLTGTITALEQEYKTNPSDELKQRIDMNKKFLEQNNGRYSNLIETQKQINTGDRKFVDRNYETLSGSAYKDAVIDSFSEAYRTDTYKYIPNAVALQADRFTFTAHENALNRQNRLDVTNLNFQKAVELEQMKEAMKTGKVKINPDGTYEIVHSPYTTADKQDLTSGYQKWKDNYAQVQKQGIAELQNFYNTYVASDWEAKGKKQSDFFNPTTGELTPAAMEYMKTKDASNSEDLHEFYNRVMPINAELKVMEAQDRVIQARMHKENPQLFNRDFLKALKPVTISGIQITGSDIQDAYENKSNKIRIIPGSGFSGNNYVPEQMFINTPQGWKKLSGSDIRGSNLNVLEQSVLSGNAENISAINSKQNDLYGQSLLVQKNWVYAQERNYDSDKDKAMPDDPIRARVWQAANESGGINLKAENILYKKLDPSTGEAIITITATGTNSRTPSAERLLKNLNDIMSADKDDNLHIYGDTIEIKVQDNSLIDSKVSSNPYLRVENDIRAMESTINNGDLPVGLRMDGEDGAKNKHDYSIIMNSPIDQFSSYKLVPFKDTDGTIKWDVQARWSGPSDETHKTGQYYITSLGDKRSTRGMTREEISSIINGYNTYNAGQ